MRQSSYKGIATINEGGMKDLNYESGGWDAKDDYDEYFKGKIGET